MTRCDDATGYCLAPIASFATRLYWPLMDKRPYYDFGDCRHAGDMYSGGDADFCTAVSLGKVPTCEAQCCG